MTAPLSNNLETLRSIARQAMLERGLLPDFSAAALSQANAPAPAANSLGAAARPGEATTIRDLRDRPWISIDNDDSRDLDQLSVTEALADGASRVLVAIADVDSRVPRDSPIDQHARQNTTSVYTAARIFPMLPERLSTDLTSLGEDQERVALVVDMVIDAGGNVTDSDIYGARVINKAKLAYPSVAAWLDGKGPQPPRVAGTPAIAEQLRLQDSVAQALGRVRHARGALTLQTLETHARFEGDTLSELVPDTKNRAADLIENLMIAANTVAARWLRSRGFAPIRRILRTPRRWDRIVALALEQGEKLPPQPDAPALNAFLEKRHRSDPDHFADLSLSVIKCLGRGEYELESDGQVPGHFALAIGDYLHSTAPNRRFPDLLNQRLIKAALAGHSAPYAGEELRSLAAHCTRQEDQAAKVERRVAKSAAALLLQSQIGAVFDAIVTGASDKGTWARVVRPPVEGRIVEAFAGLEVGERVRVKLLHTDVARGFIDFAREG
jgi:VacB/RNase II family 3'-5' exoribonuclease